MRSCFLIIPAFLLLIACNASKKVTETTIPSSFSSKDFPYIESFHQGVRLSMRGDLEGAKKAFQNCLATRQNDDAVYFSLAQIAHKQNNLAEALQYTQKAHQIDQKNIWYTEEIANLLYDSKDFEKAIPYFKKLVEYETQNLKWLYIYGDCLLRTGKVDETIKVLTQAENILGKNPELIAEKYNLLMSVKREEQAVKEVELALLEFPQEVGLIAILVDHYFKKGEDKKAFSYLTKLQEADPTNGRANVALGEYNLRTKNWDQAFTYFEKGFEDPEIEIDIKMNFVIQIQESEKVTDDRLDTLIAIILKIHPREAKAYTLAADQAIYDEQFELAKNLFNTALKFEKKIFAIWQQTYMMMYELNDIQGLYTVTKECSEYFPTNATVFYFNAIAAIELNKPDEAIESIESARVLLPSTDVEYIAELDAQKGVAYLLKNKQAEGYKLLKTAIQKDSKSNVIKSIFAEQMAKYKIHLDEALTSINQAIEASPDVAHYYYVRGLVYFAQKKYDKAIDDLEKTILFPPNEKMTPIYYERLGDSYSLNGNTTKAIAAWNHAKEKGRVSEILDKKINSKTYYEEQ